MVHVCFERSQKSAEDEENRVGGEHDDERSKMASTYKHAALNVIQTDRFNK